ncbi:unnamed protein product [Spodoptera exigua]|nr:unnamed protein product [Spodoptera exigua]
MFIKALKRLNNWEKPNHQPPLPPPPSPAHKCLLLTKGLFSHGEAKIERKSVTHRHKDNTYTKDIEVMKIMKFENNSGERMPPCETPATTKSPLKCHQSFEKYFSNAVPSPKPRLQMYNLVPTTRRVLDRFLRLMAIR